jgi:hypothetical protein
VKRRSRIVLLLAVMGALLVAGPVSAETPIHRAAVIVDTGTTVKRVCVRFTEDSISGKDALDRADVDAVYRSFGGTLGSAVCSLCGVGRSYADCLGGGGSSNYWVYWRAVAGAPSFSRSSFGVSSTRIHDGDVEGWHWGATGAPPFASVAQVCGTEVLPTSTAAPPVPPAPRPAVRTTRPPTIVRGSPPGTVSGSTGTVATMPTAPASPPAPGKVAQPGPGALAATKRVSDGHDSGPGSSLLVFGALLAALVGLGVRAGHRRRHARGR